MNVPDGQAENSSGKRPRRRAAPWLFGGLTLVLLTALVLLQVFGLWEIFTPETTTDTLIIYALSTLNFVAFFLFTFIFVRSLLKLRRERRERQLGSKIKTRLVVYFIAVSLLPVTAMALFSYMFFNRTLEKFFSPFPQDVARQAMQARDDRAAGEREALRDLTSAVSVAIAASPAAGEEGEPGQELLERLRTETGLAALVYAPPAGSHRPLVSAAAGDFRGSVGSLFLPAAEPGSHSAQSGEAAVGGKLYDVRQLPVAGGATLIAARERRGEDGLERLVAGAQTFEDFRRNQRRVRLLGLSTLGLLTLMLLFAATWSAIHLARGIGQPIRALAEAANEVAGGNLEHRVTAVADDELAVLAAAFNDMTAQLSENRRRLEQNAEELREKNLALEERRGYIETVLQTVGTGVISLDVGNRLTTVNAAALAMLRLAHAPAAGTPLAEVVTAEDYAVLESILGRARLRGRATEQLELARGAGHDAAGEAGDAQGPGVIPVALTATALAPREGGGGRGVVLVIEDLSELLAAQRAAAWSEVARRLAHEIKNPLTPIQLSAERIARNFQRLGAAEAGRAVEGNGAGSPSRAEGAAVAGHAAERERVAQVVEECTATISREVAGLKGMVDEFTRYARLPHARLEPGDLNDVVRQAVALYEERLGDVRLDVRLGHHLPAALLDPEQLRRVFVNLIDNSIEALADAEGERRVTVATGHDPARGLLIAEVADTGHGIARSDFRRLFQPYFSTRGRGTGLGLAIVHRIMAEHGGRIRAEQNRPRGARMIVELPVAEEQKQGPGAGGR
jgi:two-component system, NtrC family, nitrogen regulation sensor histidine kinase NtrY